MKRINSLKKLPSKSMKNYKYAYSAILASTILSGSIAVEAVTFEDIVKNPDTGISYQRTPSVTNAIWDAIKTEEVLFLSEASRVPMKPRGAPGVVVFDYDNDKDMDVFVTNGPNSNNSLYQNQLSESGALKFIDMGEKAGVGAVDQDNTGACFGDIDNDGDKDLMVLTIGRPNILFENQGDGTFTNITEDAAIGGGYKHSVSCAFGDVNGDGLLDVTIANTFDDWTNRTGSNLFSGVSQSEHNQLFINQGDNQFVDASAESGIQNIAGFTWAIALVDYDQDGDVDLVVADDQGPRAHADLGGIDLGFLRLYKNDGFGNFADVTEQSGTNMVGAWMGLSFADLDRNGTIDIFATNGGDYVSTMMENVPGLVDVLGPPPVIPPPPFSLTTRWFLNQDNENFTAPDVNNLGKTPFGWGVVSTDYDNDGDTDIIFHGGLDLAGIIDASNPGAILNNNGTATFSRDAQALSNSVDHMRRSVNGVAIGDLNNDGFVDLVSVSNQNLPLEVPTIPFVALLPPAEPGPFDQEASIWPVFMPVDPSDFTKGLMWTGLDPLNGTLSVEINSADNGNNWIKVKLIGSVGLLERAKVNRDGIGAVIKFKPKDAPAVIQPVLGGASYASQDSLVSSYGLGKADSADIEVLWTGGVRNRLYNVSAGQVLSFPEIPCSFDDLSVSYNSYIECVFISLKELKKAGSIRAHEKQKFLTSAVRAYYDYREGFYHDH